MRRYYFDVRDDDNLQTDDEGRDFSSVEAVQDEATVSLAELPWMRWPNVARTTA